MGLTKNKEDVREGARNDNEELAEAASGLCENGANAADDRTCRMTGLAPRSRAISSRL
jgi:hypothetical protein